MALLSPDRFTDAICTLRSTSATPPERLAAEVQLHHAALDNLDPEAAAQLVALAASGHAQAIYRLQLAACHPRPPQGRLNAPPAVIARQPPRWPLPEPPSPLLRLDPPDAPRRTFSGWRQLGLIPADLPAATFSAAFVRLHGRRPMRRNSTAVYAPLEMWRTVLTLRALRRQSGSDPAA